MIITVTNILTLLSYVKKLFIVNYIIQSSIFILRSAGQVRSNEQ